MPDLLGKPPLQVLPSGLLGFLQLKNGGKFPQSLGQELLPELDLLEWYLQANSENIPIAAQPLALGNVQFPEWTVPATECWWLLDVGAQTDVLGAGDTIRFHFRYIQANGSTGLQLSDGPANYATGQVADAGGLKRPVLLLPGDGVFLTCTVFTGAVNVTGAIRVVRCPL